MAKKSKLLTALDAHKGRNINLEKQRKQEKQAAKRKHARAQDEVDEKENLDLEADGAASESGDEYDGWETEQSQDVGMRHRPFPLNMNVEAIISRTRYPYR